MERFLLDEISVTVTLEEVIKALRVTEDDDVRLVAELFDGARAVARPKALYKVAYVDGIEGDDVTVNGVRFTSAVLARNMEGVHRVFAYVCTCGAEVDEWSASETDFVVALWLDMIKERFVYNAGAYLRAHVKEKYGIKTLSSINPGSGNVQNWPISQQKLLFPLIGDVERDAGVRLTESSLMVPIKSTSGLLFASTTEFINCSLCERANCPNRKAEYSPV